MESNWEKNDREPHLRGKFQQVNFTVGLQTISEFNSIIYNISFETMVPILFKERSIKTVIRGPYVIDVVKKTTRKSENRISQFAELEHENYLNKKSANVIRKLEIYVPSNRS